MDHFLPTEQDVLAERYYELMLSDPNGEFGFFDNLRRSARDLSEQAGRQARDILGQFREMGKQYTQDGRLIRARIGFSLKDWVRSTFNPQLVGELDAEESVPYYIKEALKSIIKEFFYVPDPNQPRTRSGGGGGGKAKKKKEDDDELSEELKKEVEEAVKKEIEEQEPSSDWEIEEEVEEEESGSEGESDPTPKPKKKKKKKYKSDDGFVIEREIGEDGTPANKWKLLDEDGKEIGEFDDIIDLEAKRAKILAFQDIEQSISQYIEAYKDEKNPLIRKTSELLAKRDNGEAQEYAQLATKITQEALKINFSGDEPRYKKGNKKFSERPDGFDNMVTMVRAAQHAVNGIENDAEIAKERRNKRVEVKVRNKNKLNKAGKNGWDGEYSHPDMSLQKDEIPGIPIDENDSDEIKNLRRKALVAHNDWERMEVEELLFREEVQDLIGDLTTDSSLQPDPEDPENDWRKNRLEALKEVFGRIEERKKNDKDTMKEALDELADKKGVKDGDRWWNSGKKGKAESSDKSSTSDESAPEPSEPEPTGSDESEPEPTGSDESAPEPSEPEPSEPEPSEPEPSTPEPSTPESSTPGSSTPELTGSDESEPEPSTPEPTAPKESPNDRAMREANEKLTKAESDISEANADVENLLMLIEDHKKSQPKQGDRPSDSKRWVNSQRKMKKTLEYHRNRLRKAEEDKRQAEGQINRINSAIDADKSKLTQKINADEETLAKEKKDQEKYFKEIMDTRFAIVQLDDTEPKSKKEKEERIKMRQELEEKLELLEEKIRPINGRIADKEFALAVRRALFAKASGGEADEIPRLRDKIDILEMNLEASQKSTADRIGRQKALREEYDSLEKEIRDLLDEPDASPFRKAKNRAKAARLQAKVSKLDGEISRNSIPPILQRALQKTEDDLKSLIEDAKMLLD